MRILFFTFSILLSFSAWAQGPVVEDVESISFIEPACPVCLGGQEVTMTTFTFSAYWCSNPVVEDTYEIQVSNIGKMSGHGYKSVAIKLKGNAVDCFGPSFKRTFQLTTKDIESDEEYILHNPTLIKGN